MTDYRAQAERLRAQINEHELSNGGCVPKPAYDELAENLKEAAWTTLTRLAKDHRHCDCTGTFPCEVRQVVDRFGREFCKPAEMPA